LPVPIFFCCVVHVSVVMHASERAIDNECMSGMVSNSSLAVLLLNL